MAFEEKSVLSQKIEFVRLALCEGANVSALCRQFGIGRTLGYTLLARHGAEGGKGLEERSRRPLTSPRRSGADVEAAVLAIRAAHPAWGGRKIAKVLERRGLAAPAPSTVTDILRRNGVALGEFGGGAKPFIRFEHERPNDLWQMDFKGHVALRHEGRLHPLTVLDDHSRFSIAIAACADETAETVKTRLAAAFRSYGLPVRMAMDNGSPWGSGGGHPFTILTVWLIEAGIRVSHSRPRHPQTLGKDERFHRTLKAETLSGEPYESHACAQAALDLWRGVYNNERPHEALGMAVPGERYAPSPRPWPETVEPWLYQTNDIVRRVQQKGEVSFKGHIVKVPKAFCGKQIALRPTAKDGIYDAWFRHQKIRPIDLNDLKGQD